MANEKKNLCTIALDLATSLCGNKKLVMLDDGHTVISVPNEVIEEVKEKAGNPGTLEERIKFLRELDWSYNWAVGMCKLLHGPEWDTLPRSEKEECIDRMLRVLAERAF